jgi:hypothetical protein
VVIGDGWAAMSSVAFLAAAGKQVIWVTGTGARLTAPLPVLDASDAGATGVQAWGALAQTYGMEIGEFAHGSFLREFRNKSFRPLLWTKAPTPEARKEVMQEMLWEAERGLAPLFEGRFALSPAEIEEKVREYLAQTPHVRRIENMPVQEVIVEAGAAAGVRLGTGEVLRSEKVIYADRWESLGQIEGLPKGLAFPKKRYPVGVLQAEFEHELPMAAGLQEAFIGSLHKEAGEEIEHHVWGYFSGDGTRSVWSLCMTPEEAEENHTIGKRLRRMKSTLDKMFAESGYFSKVKSERVRFEESILFTAGEVPTKPIALDSIQGLNFLTDGYGPTAALSQVALLLTDAIINQARSESQAENIDSSDAGTP